MLALGYAGLYVHYGVTIKQEAQKQLDDRGAEAALDLAVKGLPVFSGEVSVEFDGLQALRLGIGFGQGDD